MPPPDLGELGELAASVGAALAAGDRATLVRVLHPYLHYTDPLGRTTRGRTKVVALLEQLPEVEPPERVELRDDQVYRWTCVAAS